MQILEAQISPEAEALAKETEIILNSYQGIVVKDNTALLAAGNELKTIKGKLSDLEALRKSLTRPLDETKRRIMDFFRIPQERLEKAEGTIKRAMLQFQQEQEAIRRKEEARLQELARKEEERKKAALDARAEKAAAKGNLEKAEELRQQKEEVFVPAPVVNSSVAKVAGVATKQVWKFEISDANIIPKEYMIPDMVKIGAVVRATKGTLAIPGVEIYAEETIAAGRN
jgi:DNA repair exonuclease SbcCD ATPase subunit